MVQKNDRVELVNTGDPYTSLRQRSDKDVDSGAKGTVERIDYDPVKKIWVDWDDGSNLALIVGRDEFKVLED